MILLSNQLEEQVVENNLESKLELSNPPFFLSIDDGELNFNVLNESVVSEQRVDGILHSNRINYSGGLTAFMLISSFLIVVGFKGRLNNFYDSFKVLWQTKERGNLFYESEERHVLMRLSLRIQTILQLCFLSILYFSPIGSNNIYLSKYWLLASSLFVVFSLSVHILNFSLIRTFSSEKSWVLWKQGSYILFELFGIILFFVSISIAFGNISSEVFNFLLIIAISFYYILSIVRGLKIFFRTIFSYIYLILYLYTGILVPILLLYHVLGTLFNHI